MSQRLRTAAFFSHCWEQNPEFRVRVSRKSAVRRQQRGFGALEDLPVILVVEDDEEIQIVVEDALTEGGFEPAIAPSGEEAVTLLRGNKGNYRALVADIGLRGRMDGWEVAKHARELDPEFPIVYMTGIRKDEWGSRGVPNSILMTKPFAPAQLVTALSQLLNGGTAAT
jgi:DNA-binding response OmpR family regulator